MSDANARTPGAERPAAPWGDEITPLTEVCGGQYVLLHELARGDLSIVYRAKPARARDSIAFKVIQAKHVDDEVQVRRFRREAELLRKIEHPNVVRLIDHGTIEDGRDFLALELLVGDTLAEALGKSERMSAERTCRIARQVARALRTMHKAGVIHRDLEPGNILLIGPENAERVKLVDFAQAGDVGAPARRVKPSKGRPPSGIVTDEPSYRAPEQLRKAPPHPSMDVFALGVIMYEMLVGEHPFYLPSDAPGRPKPMTIRSKVFDAPEELLGLVADCIEEDPAERPGSMDEVIERIDKALLWMGVVPHEIAAGADEDARTQLWAAAEPVEERRTKVLRDEPPSSSGPVWSRPADEAEEAEPRPTPERASRGAEPRAAASPALAADATVTTRRRPEHHDSGATVTTRRRPERHDSGDTVTTRRRPERHDSDDTVTTRRGPEPRDSDDSLDEAAVPLSDRDSTPDPEAEQTHEPTGPHGGSGHDGPTTGSVPRIDFDELEAQPTLDDAPFVVDTVAWTKPQPAARKGGRSKGGAPQRPRASASASRRPAGGSQPSGRPRASERAEPRPQAARPRTTAAQPTVAPVPRWVLPLGLLIIALLAYGVWMVWTA